MTQRKLSVLAPEEQLDRWIAAADRAQMTVNSYVCSVLDKASIEPVHTVIERAQERWQSAGHSKACGCGWCKAPGVGGAHPLPDLP